MQSRQDPMKVSSQSALVVLTVFVLAGAALRAFDLNSGLWYDEIKTLIESVRPPLAQIVTHFPGNNDHLFYSVLAHLSIAVFGDQAWSLRLPSALFGLAAIPMLYLFAREVTGRFESVAAASLMAVSYHHVWFSQNARGYAMLLFWTLLSSYLLLRALRGDRRATYVAFAAVTALGIYTHLTMVFVVAGQGAVAAWHILVAREGRFDPRALINPALGFALAGLFTLLLYAPVLVEVQTFFAEKTVSRAQRVATPGWALLAALEGLNIGFTMAGGVVLAGLLCLVGFVSYLRQSIAVTALFILPAPITLAAAVILQRPVFPRFFFVLMGFGLMVAVRGAVVTGTWIAQRLPHGGPAQAAARAIPALLVAGLVVLSILSLPQLYAHPKQDYAGALQFVEAARQDGENILVAGGGAAYPYQTYYLKAWPRVDSAEELDAARQGGPVWLLYTFRRYIEHRQPEFWAAIQTQCSPAKVFPGTVAGADIEVLKCAARP
jgi:mannosyltransferase